MIPGQGGNRLKAWRASCPLCKRADVLVNEYEMAGGGLGVGCIDMRGCAEAFSRRPDLRGVVEGVAAPAHLRRVQRGVWVTPDGQWTFKRHESDPHPRRWFAYRDGDDFPSNEGQGHTRLAEAAAWAAVQP